MIKGTTCLFPTYPTIPHIESVGSKQEQSAGDASKTLGCSCHDHNSVSFFLTFAGTPATKVLGGTSSVTTEPAPVTAPRPTRTGAISMVSEPIFTWSSITV